MISKLKLIIEFMEELLGGKEMQAILGKIHPHGMHGPYIDRITERLAASMKTRVLIPRWRNTLRILSAQTEAALQQRQLAGYCMSFNA